MKASDAIAHQRMAPRAGFEPATNRLTARCRSITTRFNSCADRLTGLIFLAFSISNKIKAELDRRMSSILGKESQPWVIHDIRRTMRSHLSALRIPDHVAKMVIGHGRKGLQRVYDQHRYEAEMREALTLWAGRLRSIVEAPPANVVAIKRRGRNHIPSLSRASAVDVLEARNR